MYLYFVLQIYTDVFTINLTLISKISARQFFKFRFSWLYVVSETRQNEYKMEH